MFKGMLIAVLILGTAACLAADGAATATPARAEPNAWSKARRSARQAQAAERFRHADADGDGAISRAEAEAHAPRLAQKFARIDTDRDGRLTQDELRAYREAKRGRAARGR
jgi:Ca2+-binding EF-hand superfamily protein